ncbi:hypothetical protein Daura_12365 [Dactylosporangium aurantiacum]|uniref:Uncharacterized protein n=1 Tax=Dactylosporangium aurantiacum TaxID=35754 RepID=A0A9Q9IPY4_9ACTN|nr:hypothetical protein [Dactylosporangium aurantiacum]MDG6104092.1 hypothetical protein [Dactylosporangium aurantiacum]UWZ56893.1 hypothetical protein Daura_12365 [Dactylosporangium aurantiacum]
MTIRTEPVPARTDLHDLPQPPAAVTAGGVRALGLALTAGTAAWATSMFTVGNNPTDSLGLTITDVTGGMFQLGLFALLAIQVRTRATGLTKVARGMLVVEHVLLAVATVWSFLHAVPALRDAVWLIPMDVFWPLSMLGMAVIGVKILFAGRWKGVVRVWPTVAESWAVVTVPTFAIFGSPVADYIGGAHLIVGYATLGVILMLRPQLTGAR